VCTEQYTNEMEKKCGNCKHVLLLLCFATKPKTNELYVNCEKCRSKDADQKRKKRAADKAERDAVLEAGGKLVCQDCGLQPLEAFGLNPTTGKPLTRCKPCNEKNNAQDAEYKKTEAGKAVRKKYNESEIGKAAVKRFRDNRTERRHESTAMRMDDTIMSASNSLIRGRYMTSPTFLERTSFTSEVHYLSVLEATFEGEMTLANHGPVWEVEHKIPREAYDFDDPEDVNRCWSAKNVHAMTVAANKEKSWQLLDEYITAAGVANFPKAWNGKHPDAAFKAIHNAKMMAWKMLADAASEQPSGSNDVAPMDDFDSN